MEPTIAPSSTSVADLVRRCSGLSLVVEAQPLEQLLRGLLAHVEQQDAAIARLTHALENVQRVHSGEMEALRQEFEQRLRYTVENVATALDAVRNETASVCHKALPDVHAIPSLMERARRLEQNVETLREVNTQRSVEYVALSDRLDVALQHASTPLRHNGSTRGGPMTPQQQHFGDASWGSQPATDLAGHVEQLRRDMDDLLTLLEIPNVFSSRSQRSLVSTSLHRIAGQNQEQRIRFLHGLPCFHILWTELYRLQKKVAHPDGRSPSGLDGPASFVASPLRFHHNDDAERGGTPVRQHASGRTSPSVHHGTQRPESSSAARNGPGSSVFIPQLGADVAALSSSPAAAANSSSGVTVIRLVRGGALEACGVAVGDTIVAIDGVPLAGVFHLMDMVHDAAANVTVANAPAVCTLALIPAGRANALPISVRLAIGSSSKSQ